MKCDIDAKQDLASGIADPAVVDDPICGDQLPTDRALLREYAAAKSDVIFSQLVERHVSLVYSAAMRQVRNHAMAQDVTQAVFIILARKAAALRDETVLAGWLFRAVRYAALDALKMEARREVREEEAAQMEMIEALPNTEADWQPVAPLLDEALATLKPKDRHAVLLRFFEKKSFGEIGAALGGNENSARVRVVRAVEKLRRFFQRRGVAVSAVILSSLLTSNAVQAAPPATLSMLMSGATQSSEAVTRLVDAILRCIRRKQNARLGALVALLLLLLLLRVGPALISARPPPLPAQSAATATSTLRETFINIERTFVSDPNGFAALIHFRGAEDEPFRPVLVDYVRAQEGFCKEMKRVFRSQGRPFNIAFKELCVGQPPILKQYVGPDRVATNLMMAHYPVYLVRIGAEWKWDLFGGLSPEGREEWMTGLKEKTQLFDKIAFQVREGTLTNLTEILQTARGTTR